MDIPLPLPLPIINQQYADVYSVLNYLPEQLRNPASAPVEHLG